MHSGSGKKFPEIRLQGYPICPGIAIGKPFIFTVLEEKITEFSVSAEEVEKEVAKWYTALKKSRKDVLTLQKKLQKQEGGKEGVDILGTHLEILQDPLMTIQIEEQIRSKRKNTEYIFKSVIKEYEQKFHKITNQFFRERLQDFQDIARRIFSHLHCIARHSLADIDSEKIVFAHELSPSDTAEAKADLILAFVTRSGAETSHVAIMARSMGIPFVTNVDFPIMNLSIGSQVIVDGNCGDVFINPSSDTLMEYSERKKKLKIHVQDLKKIHSLPGETIDGYRARITANLEMLGEEYETIPACGGEGIGLFRSEYIFLSRETFPPEEEQLAVYRKLVEKVGPYPCVVRTFDIGGDKFSSYHPTQFEKNPYLGCRAIRLMLKQKKDFKTQLRAIIRASAFGEIKILVPMVSGIQELRDVKQIIKEAKEELQQEEIPFSRSIPLGCMIEVPSAAITIDHFISECDFFSIGTNDLVQYSIAVDRGNQALRYLYQSSHPSILRLIKTIVVEANKAQKPVSICGEMAGDPLYTPLLLGLGIHEFSVSLPMIPIVKKLIRCLCYIDTVDLAENALMLKTSNEIEALLHAFYKKTVDTYPSGHFLTDTRHL